MAYRRAAAEFIGTFVLVFGGVGSAVIAGEAIGNLGIAFAFGLSLLAMAYAIGPISGCHINPAATVGLLLSKRIEINEAIRYWIAQVQGTIRRGARPVHRHQGARGRLWGHRQGLRRQRVRRALAGRLPAGRRAARGDRPHLLPRLHSARGNRSDRQRRVRRHPDRPCAHAHPSRGHPGDQPVVHPARSSGPAVFVGDWALSPLWLFIVALPIGAALASLVHTFLFTGAAPVDSKQSAVAAEDAATRSAARRTARDGGA